MAKPVKKRTTSKSRSTTRKKVIPSRSSRSNTASKSKKNSQQISPERKKDITGIIFLLVGVLTLLSLFTIQTGTITGSWINLLGKIIGWGRFILPFIFIFLGFWILLRNSNKLPKISTERVVGLILGFLNLLTWFHFFSKGDLTTAPNGMGGGYTGAGIKQLLVNTIGTPGSIILLVAWLITSLILILDLSMSDFTKGFDTLLNKFRELFTCLHLKVKSKKSSNNNSINDLSKGININNPHTKQADGSQESTSQPVAQIAPPNSMPHSVSKFTNSDSPREWVLPDPYKILKPPKPTIGDEENDQHRARVIEESLKSFGAPAHVVEIRRGPSITLFGVEPDFVEGRSGRTRVRVSRITNLADDLAMALKASRIRIQAPVPGKGYVGIEVPNREIAIVSLLEVLTSQRFTQINSPLKFALGKDVTGNAAAADLTAMPHLLIAGTTNSGKSVCINAILACYLLTNTPDQLRLILVDPKRVELTGYNGIPHLLAPVIVDADRVVGALQWMLREMDSRYRKFSECGTRNIQEFNAWRIERNESPIPNLLVVIDELADLMMLAPDETERALTRLAQLARATGIHLILATQRPSTDILTGLIKANFPARIAFAVAQGVDSRVILDQPGAERLLGKGDMLFQAPDAPAPVRLQGTYVSDDEISHIVSFWRQQAINEDAPTRPSQPAAFTMPLNAPFKQDLIWEEMEKDPDEDPMTKEAIAIIRQEGRASISMLQRKFRIGYTRAARLIESIQEKGIIGPPDSQTQVREVLDYGTIGPPVED